MKLAQLLLTGLLITSMGTGCAAFRSSIDDRDPATSDALSAKYDQRDLLSWADQTADLILEHPFPPPEVQAKPIIADLGIQNRTQTHMDMKAIADTITTHLLDSGKVRLVNTARRDDLLKEQGYQLQNCPPEARAAIGKQLGANYMLTGSLIEIDRQSGREVRVSKKKDVFYQLTVELTDLQTSEIVLRKQTDRLRRERMPIIGW